MKKALLFAAVAGMMMTSLWVVAAPAQALPVGETCMERAVQLTRGVSAAAGVCIALVPGTAVDPDATCALPSPTDFPSLAIGCQASFASDGRSYVSGYFSL